MANDTSLGSLPATSTKLKPETDYEQDWKRPTKVDVATAECSSHRPPATQCSEHIYKTPAPISIFAGVGFIKPTAIVGEPFEAAEQRKIFLYNVLSRLEHWSVTSRPVYSHWFSQRLGKTMQCKSSAETPHSQRENDMGLPMKPSTTAPLVEPSTGAISHHCLY